jgi:hypothetical protein
MKLSDEAQSVLINTTGGVSGTMVVRCSVPVSQELREAKLIGRLGGLTRLGTIERERLLAEAEDKAFG